MAKKDIAKEILKLHKCNVTNAKIARYLNIGEDFVKLIINDAIEKENSDEER